VTIEPADKRHYVDVCVGNDCLTVREEQIDPDAMVVSGQIDRSAYAVLNVSIAGEPHFWLVDPYGVKHRELEAGVGAPCGEAHRDGSFVLVTTNDCSNGGVVGVLFGYDGRRIVRVGATHALDTRNAFIAKGQRSIALVVPRSYAMVFFDPDRRTQTEVDLVSLQARATTRPEYEARELPDGNWLVANGTGAVGIVDRNTTTLTKTWIVPRCEEPSGP
jgi:hypothetical protein